MSDSPIFIVGCPRSGTGLLRDLLRSHPHLAFPGESHFIPRLYKAYGDPRNEREACQLADTILKINWVRVWGLNLDLSSFAHCRSYREIVSLIYDEWMRKEGKLRWGDKTPQYVSEIPTLLRIFPSCKIIHIYRDGRDVALSSMRAHFGPENVFTAASQWKHYVNIGCRVGATLPRGTYFEVCYEALLSQPEATMERVCQFLDEPFCRDVLKPDFLERLNRPAIIGTRAPTAISRTEIATSNSGKWKKAMSLSDRILFESIAGDLLTLLGYETEGKTRHIYKSERLKWKAHHAFWYFLQRLNTKNKRPWFVTMLLMRWADIRYRLRLVGILSPFPKS